MMKYYWGKYKKVKGKMIKVWTKEPMTYEEMDEFDCTYRHMCKEVDCHNLTKGMNDVNN